ncbi:MAG: BspA family leucine-rich repeat surface protein [Bacilli bacterium]|nr:BspA family leucine-rich repeat surface protein [Bacilli bacterium]
MEKRKNKKKSTLVLLLLLLVGISIGYAALTSNLNIHGNTKIKKAEWDVHFENLVKSEGSESADKEAVIDASKTLIKYTVKLPEPGDFYEFTVDIVNKGSIDAMVSEVLKTGLTTDQEKYIEYTATHTNGKELKQYDSLKAGQTRKIKIRVKYKDDLNPEDLPTEDKSIDLSFQVTYVQADERVTKTTPSIMAASILKTNVASSKITKIEFKVDEEIPTTAIDSWDVSQNQDKSVMAYIEDDKTGNGTYKVTIVGDGNVTANEDSSGLFNNFSNLEEIDLSNLDTSKVTKMDGMFAGCKSLTTLDVSNLDTSSVKSMVAMFQNCSSLTSLNLSDFDTSSVINMNAIFSGCSSLTSLDLSNLDTSSVTNMSAIFSGCSNLTSVNLSNTDLSSVTDMGGMFNGCSRLTSVNLSNTDLSSVTDMGGMFWRCSNLTTTITINSSKVTDYSGMFSYAATNDGAQITVNYTNDTSSIVDQMIATKSENSNVVKGALVSN